jgi:predicted DCC family thiol-disulfide oxidoreductase YuxK
MQLAEGRPLAEQIGINPDRPDSFAFVANGLGIAVHLAARIWIRRARARWLFPGP